MEHTRFVGLDIHKERISIAVAESGRTGALEYLGEIANDAGAISKLCDRLRRPGKPLAFCYEAGPCGYGVHRQLTNLGHRCDVMAPRRTVSPLDRSPGTRPKYAMSWRGFEKRVKSPISAASTTALISAIPRIACKASTTGLRFHSGRRLDICSSTRCSRRSASMTAST